MSPTIRIFDPAMCCDSGVCGAEVDPALVRISADIGWARAQGARVDRLNLAREPQAFVDEPTVRRLLGQVGREALPVTLVDGELVLSGRYPDRAQLAKWTGLGADAASAPSPTIPIAAPAPACACSGGRCGD